MICEVAAVKPHLEGFDSTQKELLRCRKKTKKYMTEVDKWYEVYMILFPGADPVHLPTPCESPGS